MTYLSAPNMATQGVQQKNNRPGECWSLLTQIPSAEVLRRLPAVCDQVWTCSPALLSWQQYQQVRARSPAAWSEVLQLATSERSMHVWVCAARLGLSAGMQPLSRAPHALPSWLEVGSVCVRWNRDGREGGRRREGGGNIREHTPEPGCWLVVEGVPKGQRCRKEKQMRGLETGCRY